MANCGCVYDWQAMLYSHVSVWQSHDRLSYVVEPCQHLYVVEDGKPQQCLTSHDSPKDGTCRRAMVGRVVVELARPSLTTWRVKDDLASQTTVAQYGRTMGQCDRDMAEYGRTTGQCDTLWQTRV